MEQKKQNPIGQGKGESGGLDGVELRLPVFFYCDKNIQNKMYHFSHF